MKLEFTINRGIFSAGFGCLIGIINEPGTPQDTAIHALSYGAFWGIFGLLWNQFSPIKRPIDYLLKDSACISTGYIIGQGLKSFL